MLAFIITGLVTGSLYGLTGMGLVLTYRTSGVFNFGHGAIAAASAYVFYYLHVEHHMAWPLAAVIVVIGFAVVIGWVMELITRGLGNVPEAVVVVATIGLMLGTEGLLFLVFGGTQKLFPQFLPSGNSFTLQDVNVTWAQLISILFATASAVGLFLFLRSSRLGVSMRAVVDNPTLTALSGERPIRIRQASWMIACAFAAISGCLLAPTLGLDANLLTLLVVQAFGACAIGLFKSLPMTYVGGLVVGVAASIATDIWQDGILRGLPPAVPFVFLFAVLVAVPASKLPRRRSENGSLIPEVAPMSKRTATVLGVVALVGLAIVPHVVGTHLPNWIAAGTDVVIFGSLALLVWVSGQISLCHAAFVALGASTMSHMLSHGVPWIPALLLAGLFTVPVGFIVALPAIRLSGLYLALATLGFGVFMQDVVYPSSWMFGQDLTAEATRPAGATSDVRYYYVVMGVAVIGCIGLATIYRSRLGRVLRALSESPTMLVTNGLGVSMTRIVVFCISAFYAGIAGALLVSQFSSAGSVSFGPIQSLLYLAVLAICGTRLLRSAILGAVLLALVPGYMGSFDQNKQLFGFGLVAVIASVLLAQRRQVTALMARTLIVDEGWVAQSRRIATSLRDRAGGVAPRADVLPEAEPEPPSPPSASNGSPSNGSSARAQRLSAAVRRASA